MDRRHFITNSAVAFGSVLSGEAAGAAAPQKGAGKPAAPQSARITLNDKEYFEAPGFVCLPYHNSYSGTRGGLQIMQRGEWLTGSELLISGNRGPGQLPARVSRRVVDRETSAVTITGEVAGLNVGYRLVCRTDGERIFVKLRFDQPLDWSKVRHAAFRLYLYPPAYFSKSFQGDTGTGVFPRQYDGQPLLMKSSGVLRIAQEDPSCSFTFERRGGVLELGDDRGSHPTGWLTITAPLEPGSSDTEIDVEITPSKIDPKWLRAPVIGVSQVGYHPRQRKVAVLEIDPRDQVTGKVNLFKLSVSGHRELVRSDAAKPWGRFLYYQYATFDFTDIVSPGVYFLEYGDQTAGPFRIGRDVYDQAWQPTLEVFLPVQMCHVSVRERNRFWHGPCHLDDALQAPENTRHFDGYQQGARETKFADYEHIPGLNWGGWHDAGDFDLPAGSITSTTLALALAQEEFKPGIDRTTIHRASREVLLHEPDGEEDLLQQIEYGVEGLLASFRVAGHIFPGIIESSRDQYDVTGDGVNITDNRVYDGSLKPDEVTLDRAGKRDDRWVFTNRNTGLQYRVAQMLAVASRVFRGQKDALADECLDAAKKLWEYEQTHAPSYAPNSYVGGGGRFPGDEIAATVELWLTSDDARYQKRFGELLPAIQSAPAEQVGRGSGWMLVRLLPKVSDPEFRSLIFEIAKKSRAAADAVEASNPYRVRFPSWVKPDWKLDSPRQARGNSIMGFGWNMQSDAMRDYFFHKHLPEICGADTLLNVVNFVLGCHPANNRSYVSGVGTNSPLIAYGFNRDDYSYIPGGVISGASFMHPEFMDLKNFPYYFNQTEYVIHGAGSYIFVVLAARWILEHQPSREAGN